MNKNWIGNSNSIYKVLGASNHTKEERQAEDFYATTSKATELLLGLEDINKEIIDNSVGEGHLVKPLIDLGYDVEGYDIVDRGFPNTKVENFLQTKFLYPVRKDIIMNPPYRYAKDFVEKSMGILADGYKLFAFLKIQFLESKGRKQLFKDYPPKTIYVASSRLTCAKNADFDKMKKSGGSAACYCWYVFEKGYKGETTLKWFN